MIRKTEPSEKQAHESIKKARIFLSEAKADFEGGRFDAAMIIAYLALLNASRAILFRDGYREKSHICITRYLEIKYKEVFSVKYIEMLDHFRETRHDVQYEPDYFAEEEDANQILQFAEEFISIVEKLIKK